MVTWQIINILSLRPDHTSERFTASTSVKISAVDGIVLHPVAMLGRAGRASPSSSHWSKDPSCVQPGRLAPRDLCHHSTCPPQHLGGGRRRPLPSCPWDSSVAQPKFPHPGFELSAHVSVTASGAAGAPCHQRAVVAEEHSPPSPCPWPSFHLPHRASPDPLEHSGTSRGFAVAPRNSSAVVMKVCLLSSLCCASRSCARHAGRPLVPSLCSPPCGCISPHAHPRTQPHLSRSTPGPGWGLWHGHRSEEQLGTGVPRRRTQHPCARGTRRSGQHPQGCGGQGCRSSPCRALALSVRNCEPRPSCGRGKAGGG